MDAYSPFAGVLLLPDKAPFGSTSPVQFDDGRPAASIRWHNWSLKARFEILDPVAGILLASGGRSGLGSRNYQVAGARGEELLRLRLSFWGLNGRSAVTLPGGRELTAKGNWSARRFVVSDESGEPVAHLVNNSRFFSMRPDSLAFELLLPVLSIVQAVGLAQCMRAAVEAQQTAVIATNG
jgi:hypothetical protein